MAPTRRGRLPPLLLPLLALLLAFAASTARAAEGDGYYGKFLGKLKTLHHSVAGDVYAVDARTLHIRNFNYDGEGPAAFFYAGDSKSPNGSGFRINDEKGSPNVLPKYRNKHITLTLPENKTLRDIRWFSVWCDEFSVNFGDVRVPKGFEYPRPQKVDALRGVHGVASEPIVVVDAQTLLVPAFSYDGEAPDAKFWVGSGAKPSPQGTRVPDENGKEAPLRRYDRKTIVLTLPGDVTVHDIGHFGVWCEAFTVDFGHVRLPRALNVPPSLKMLGVSPQKTPRSLQQYQQLFQQEPFEHNTYNDRNRQQQLAFENGGRRANLYEAEPPRSHFPSAPEAAFDPRAQQHLRATTYRPAAHPRPAPHARSADAPQIVPSISISLPSDPYFEPRQHQQQQQQQQAAQRRQFYSEQQQQQQLQHQAQAHAHAQPQAQAQAANPRYDRFAADASSHHFLRQGAAPHVQYDVAQRQGVERRYDRF